MLWSNRSKYPPQRFMQNSFKNCGCNFQAHHLTGSFKTPQRDVNLGASAPLSCEPQQLSCCDLIRVAYRPDGPLAPPPCRSSDPTPRSPLKFHSLAAWHQLPWRRRPAAAARTLTDFFKFFEDFEPCKTNRALKGMKEA